jgi:sulfate adenylyltransferase subunit 2
LPNLYFAHRRPVVQRGGVLLAVTDCTPLLAGEKPDERLVRFRTVGDATCTGAIESSATTLDHIITEVAAARVTERGGRADDKRSDTAMEDRKKQGYF